MKHVMAELHEIINELEDQGLIKEASSLIDVFNGMYKRAYNNGFGETRVVAPRLDRNPNWNPGDPVPNANKVQEFAFGDSMEESDESSLPDMITEAVNKYGVADLILEIAKQIGK